MDRLLFHHLDGQLDLLPKDTKSILVKNSVQSMRAVVIRLSIDQRLETPTIWYSDIPFNTLRKMLVQIGLDHIRMSSVNRMKSHGVEMA
jgi:aryl carrier-like protein